MRVRNFLVLFLFVAQSLCASDIPPQFISQTPERYQALDTATRDLLARSVLAKKLIAPDSRGFSGTTLWQFLDEKFSPSLLEALVQTRQAAQDLGLANAVVELREVYSGTSWGIKFYGPDALIAQRLTRSDFCHDMDSFVRREHGNTEHAWWRHLVSTVGLGSLHLGISAGAGYHDLHFDTTNPAQSRGSFGNPDLCSYSFRRLIAHNNDIHGKQFTSELRDFLKLEHLGYFQWRLNSVIDNDLKYSPPANRHGWPELLTTVQKIVAQQSRVTDEAKRLATRLDGITRFHSELGEALNTQAGQTKQALDSFIALVLQDSTENEALPERQDLLELRDRLAKADAFELSSHDIDWLIGVYYHAREYVNSAHKN